MEGFRAVPHDLLDLKDAGTLYVAGDARAKHVVFFCAGFPDDHSAFAPLAARLAASRGCLVGLSCIAEYEREAPLRPQGYDLDEMAACFAQGVAALRALATRAGGHELTVVVHDWGIAPGFMFSNAVGCDRLVVFDVLPAGPSERPDKLYYALVHLNYQGMFAISFALSRFVSARLA